MENPSLHMAELLARAVGLALDQKDPKRKLERRAKRKITRASMKSRPDEIFAAGRKAVSRYIPSEVRERVHERAGYQCELRGPDGTRCRSRTGLEVEHVRPLAIHRSHDEKYLRLYCSAHNRWSAECVYGVAFMKSKIEAARRASAG